MYVKVGVRYETQCLLNETNQNISYSVDPILVHV